MTFKIKIFGSLYKILERISSLPRMATNLKYLSRDEAISLDQELFNDAKFDVSQLMELAGLSVSISIAKLYNKSSHSKVIVCCGPGNNGGDGLVCARHLKMFGYSPTVIWPKQTEKPLYSILKNQCIKFGIEVSKNLSINEFDSNTIIVDAIFGFSYIGPNRSLEFAKIIKIMHEASKKCPLVSVDIPSGWDVEDGPKYLERNQSSLDESLRLPVLQPDCLVSLTSPKLCAREFKGRFHFLGGRFCPDYLAKKYELNLPPYPDTDLVQLLDGSLNKN